MQENKVVNEQHRSFLNKRGITDKVIDAFSIYTSDVADLGLTDAIVIPVKFPDGSHNFNKYRRNPLEGDVKPKYLYDKGGKITLYGANHLVAASKVVNQHKFEDGLSKVVITEGELDTLVCWSQNIPAVSSTGGSMSFQEDWAESFKGLDVYVCFDNDEAGYKGMLKVLDYIPDAKIVIIPHNLGVKDISDFVEKGGNMHALLQSAYSVSDVEEARAIAEKLGGQWRVEEAKFFQMYIEKNTVSNIPNSTTGGLNLDPKIHGRLEAAKSVDCRTLIEFVKVGRHYKAKCLWHNDSDPSLTYYEKTNTCYCFVCGKYADAIDIVMARDNVNFKQAIKILLKEV